MLAYVTGPVDGGLLLRDEDLVTEDRGLRAPVKGRFRHGNPR